MPKPMLFYNEQECVLFSVLLFYLYGYIKSIMEENIANERFDRMEQHLSLIKTRNQEISTDVFQIKQALIGNDFTAGKGFIHVVEDVKKRIEETEEDVALLKENINTLKWIMGGVGSLIVALVMYIITK